MKAFAYLIFGFFVSVVGGIWRGFVFSKLWKWFIVTTFDMQPIGIVASIGISYVVSFLTYQYVYAADERPEGEKLAAIVGVTFLFPLIYLFFGAIMKNFL